jgi:hypothetical protein
MYKVQRLDTLKIENENIKIKEYIRMNAIRYTLMYLNSEFYIPDNGHLFGRNI